MAVSLRRDDEVIARAQASKTKCSIACRLNSAGSATPFDDISTIPRARAKRSCARASFGNFATRGVAPTISHAAWNASTSASGTGLPGLFMSVAATNIDGSGTHMSDEREGSVDLRTCMRNGFRWMRLDRRTKARRMSFNEVSSIARCSFFHRCILPNKRQRMPVKEQRVSKSGVSEEEDKKTSGTSPDSVASVWEGRQLELTPFAM